MNGYAECHEVADGRSVNIASPSHMLATKLDAFFDRGKEDYYASRDLEDVVVLLEGCSRLLVDLRASSEALRNHVSRGMRRLLETPALIEALPAHLSPESPTGVLDRVLQVAGQVAATAEGPRPPRPFNLRAPRARLRRLVGLRCHSDSPRRHGATEPESTRSRLRLATARQGLANAASPLARSAAIRSPG